jgi:hypothetical protein
MVSRKEELMLVMENDEVKIVKSKDYNYHFNKRDGRFARWGKKLEDDPIVAPSPELADVEIVSGGPCLGKCNFCYKCNNINSIKKVMTFDQFKRIFHLFPKLLNQIAFGITDIYANPDFFKIMEYTRENEIIPNYTTHGIDLDAKAVELTAKLCGAVAVSIVNKEKSYDAIASFTKAGMNQVNIHYMLSLETYEKAFKIIDDIKSDPRLAQINAIVFLQYKDKNPYSKFHSVLDIEKYKKLISYCEDKKINYGLDSCSSNIFIESIKDRENRVQLEQCVDSCESMRMSIYVNCDGFAFPCSFCENMLGWETGIDLFKIKDFVKEVWHHERVESWRKALIATMKNGCACCPIYNLTPIEKIV